MSRCKSCGAEIMWITTTTGKKMPVDADPVQFHQDPAGREIFVTKGGAVVRGITAKAGEKDVSTGYNSHFATCPFADQHRRR